MSVPTGRARALNREMGPSRRRSLFALAVAAHLLVLYWPATPDPSTLPSLPGVDKLVHVAVFAAVGWAGLRAGLRPIWLIPALALHAPGSEVVQATVLADRSGDAWDVLADLAGTALGAGLASSRVALARDWLARASWAGGRRDRDEPADAGGLPPRGDTGAG